MQVEEYLNFDEIVALHEQVVIERMRKALQAVLNIVSQIDGDDLVEWTGLETARDVSDRVKVVLSESDIEPLDFDRNIPFWEVGL